MSARLPTNSISIPDLLKSMHQILNCSQDSVKRKHWTHSGTWKIHRLKAGHDLIYHRRLILPPLLAEVVFFGHVWVFAPCVFFSLFNPTLSRKYSYLNVDFFVENVALRMYCIDSGAIAFMLVKLFSYGWLNVKFANFSVITAIYDRWWLLWESLTFKFWIRICTWLVGEAPIHRCLFDLL